MIFSNKELFNMNNFVADFSEADEYG